MCIVVSKKERLAAAGGNFIARSLNYQKFEPCFFNLVASMVGWDLIALNVRHCLDVKMVNVWIVQTLVFAMLVGKEHYVMNLIVGRCLIVLLACFDRL